MIGRVVSMSGPYDRGEMPSTNAAFPIIA